MAQALIERESGQAEARTAQPITKWGDPSQMTAGRFAEILSEMAAEGISQFNFRGSLDDFMRVLAELRLRCQTEEGRQPLMGQIGAMSSALEDILDRHPIEHFNSGGEMRMIAMTRDALVGLVHSATVMIGAGTVGAPPALTLPTAPEAIPVSVEGLGNFVVEFNPQWLGLFELDEQRVINAQLAAQAGFYDLIGDRALATRYGQEWIQDTVDNINHWNRANGIADEITVEGLRTGNWGGEETENFIRERFGISSGQVGSILDVLNKIYAGNILDALRSAPANTTLSRTLADVVAGSLSNVQMRVPVYTMQLGATANVYDSDLMFINAVAFAELVLSRNYTISATRIEDGSGRWNVSLDPSNSLEELAGGGGGAVAGFYAGDRARTVSLSVIGEWDANLQEAVGRATVRFDDASGNPFGIPMDGKMYVAMLASVDTEGRLHASGTIQAAVVSNDRYTLMISFGGAYGTNIIESSQDWLNRIGERDYWTLMPGVTFDIRNIDAEGLDRVTVGAHALVDQNGEQAGVMGTVNFQGGYAEEREWNLGIEAGWRRLIVLPDLGEMIVNENGTIDTAQFGLRVEF